MYSTIEDYVNMALYKSCILLKQQPAALFQRLLLPSANAPTNPFLMNSKKSDDRNVQQTHINTVDAHTFQWV